MKNNTTTAAKSSRTSPKISESASVEQLTQRNVDTIIKLEAAADAQRTTSDRIAEVIANFCGSMNFVWVHVLWFGAWILLNLLPGVRHIDPFPFTFLTLVVSLEAIFLSTFILISQNHETRISKRRSHLDLQLNLLSEQENTTMITMLRQIAAKVGADLADRNLETLEEETRPETLVEQLEKAEDNNDPQ